MGTNIDFINEIKDTVNTQLFPPDYDPNKWRGKIFNCYLYAIGACVDVELSYGWVGPGFISKTRQSDHYASKDSVLRPFIMDLKELGLKVKQTKLDSKNPPNSYKVAVYIKKEEDYHFIRQDSDGYWSEKPGWFQSIRRVDTIPKKYREYELIGIFNISKK